MDMILYPMSKSKIASIELLNIAATGPICLTKLMGSFVWTGSVLSDHCWLIFLAERPIIYDWNISLRNNGAAILTRVSE